MSNQEIYELLEYFQRSGIAKLSIEREGFSIEMSKPDAASSPAVVQAPAVQVNQIVQDAPEKDDGNYIKAPLIGTFYTSPAPDEEPYARSGRSIKAGETVCLIEAMKMMSEIPAPCDLEIIDCMAENGSLVEYNAPLFSYRAV